ncbi:hypothetical protein ABW21_db0203198 [Orbilia brochopaga]|nr:hypothetical protein ABW21_db0203198 [Drechslerella brochopaga]
MLHSTIALTAVVSFTATVLGTALPGSYDIFYRSPDLPNDQYSYETDDAWGKIELLFPMVLYGKTVARKNAWMSMNGILSFDKPNTCSTVPNQPQLPVKQNRPNSKGCLPAQSVAIYWQDMWMPPKTDTLSVSYEWVIPSKPNTSRTMTFYWYACDKLSKGKCNRDYPVPLDSQWKPTVMTYFEDEPNVLHIEYWFASINATTATMGVQVLPHYKQYIYNESPSSNPNGACIKIDTTKNSIEQEPCPFA